jgi:hypothetical protein
MAIGETQLETWSSVGSVTQSSQTYATVKLALESKESAYSSRLYSCFLQGSYGNDTNVYSDSDVDVVIKMQDIFYYDTSRMTPADLAAFNQSLSTGSGYNYDQFRGEVSTILQKRFGADAAPDKKVIWVKPNAGRRNTDVLPAVQFRRYYRYTGNASDYAEGICFWPTGGGRVENFPKQHAENLTTKHQTTSSRFKPTVRVWKNIRNRMTEKGLIKDGTAPSYYLEGLLYNVPNENFVQSRVQTFANCMNWIYASKREDLVCANNMFWLLRDNQATSWSPQSCEGFLAAALKFWNDGGR